MDTIVIYSLKVAISLAVFYGLHMLFFRSETFFKIRRAYFLFTLVFSFLFPFLTLDLGFNGDTNLMPHILLNEIIVGNGTDLGINSLNIWSIIISISLAISGVFLIRFGFQLLGVLRMLRKQPAVDAEGCNLIYVEDDKVPTCSFFNWLIINTKGRDLEQQNDMLEHEKVHIRQHHSVDVLLFETLCILFWWNPFAWLLKREMKLNLEYLADAGVQASKEDMREYQYLLLQISTANTGVAIINNFNVSQLKKRIIMMNKKRSSLLSSAKYLLALPMACLLICSNSGTIKAQQDVPVTEVNTSIQDNEKEATLIDDEPEKPYTTTEIMPQFVGGNKAMIEYIKTNLKYPETAKNAKIEGLVVVRFIVSKTGEIKEAQVMRRLDPDCDAEAVRVVESMPKWKPGKQNGKEVDVYFTLPFVFKL